MARTLQELLVKALEKLSDQGFQRFVDKLRDWKVRKEYKRIQEHVITGKNPESIAHVIIESYRQAYGAEVTLAVLEDIGESKVRQELQHDLKEVDISGQGLGTITFTDRVNFIENLGSGLITTIDEVDPVLQTLQDQNLLSVEQCKDLMKKTTSKEKMRDLCTIISHWEDTGKYAAYTAIKIHNRFFFQRLEEDWMRRRLLDKVNFMTWHRSDLITKVTDVDPVLHDLRDQGLLTAEEYHELWKKTFSEKKMIKLCDIISHWDDIGMYTAYRVLRKYNKNIIRRLEVKDMVWINAWSHVWGDDHFVDRHRYHLIDNITEVDSVLQDLHSKKLLTWAECTNVQSRTWPEEKMKLLSYIFRIQTDTVKDQFYISLWRSNYTVINNLEESDKEPKFSESTTSYNPRAGVHFIDRNKELLIERIKSVSLYNLYHKDLLTIGELEYIEQILNPKELMRLLYDVMREWDEEEKEDVYQMFNKYNPWVFNDLKKMEKSSKLEESTGSQFIDKYKDYLIKRIMYVYPVINYLCHQDLLISEEFDYSRSRPDAKVTMRLLYDVIRDWDYGDKELVYQMFNNFNHHVIFDLKVMERAPELEKPRLIRRRPGATMETLPNTKESHTSYSGMLEDAISCTLCDKLEKAVTSSVITPTVTGRTYSLIINSPGLFRCSESGIQFLVTRPVTLEYEVDSWSNFSEVLQTLPDGYEIIGPLYNIKSAINPFAVSAVYLPHCLCVGAFKGNTSLIKCFHYKDDHMTLETPSRVEATYAVLENPTFSCFGVILSSLKIKRKIRCHGMVLLFCNTIIREHHNPMYRLHLYLLPMIRTAEKAVMDVERESSFQRIPKPPQTGIVYSKKNYKVIGPENSIIIPPRKC
ncbi:uncharacterized protein ACNLHF_017566 [Anomaloglossus baeobatrachus]|uniref:uncharacterized protein LOC142302170 n=1 Tax=Anomaloglossus baeobatrachus TaxID=238106 RepID=UPI003F501532